MSLRCAECGERVVRGRMGRPWAHAPRLVAACEIDSDHAPAPDWRALGEIPCGRCGAPATSDDGTFHHVDPAREADHPAAVALTIV